MNRISNDFVTIEYDSEKERQTADYYIKLFAKEPEFYKMILNGKTIIHNDELVEVTFTDEKYDFLKILIEQQNKERIVNSILRLEKSKQLHFYEPSMADIYYQIVFLFRDKPSEVDIWQTYYELGYYYYKLTKDFKYLKDYFYDDASLREQAPNIANYLVINMYDELLKEKIIQDRRRESFGHIPENFQEIMKITEYINDVSKEEYSLCDEKTKIPTITDEEFKQLVVGALNYIDSTNKLLEEYKQADKEGRIVLKPAEEGKASNSNCFNIVESDYYFKEEIKVTGYGIELYKKNTIEDVSTFLHEFGHYHYRTNNLSVKNHNEIFSECPSIYYELKTLEFLETMGYSKKEILAIKKMRLENNVLIIMLTLPNIYCLCQNTNKAPEECESEQIKEYINYFIDNYIDDNIVKDTTFFDRAGEITRDNKKVFSMYVSILTKEEIINCLAYIIGTYFSEYAIANLEHKKVLKILNKMKTTKLTLEEVQDMLYSNTSSKEKNSQYVKQK